MRKILVIWEEVPDRTKLYIIEPSSMEEQKKILLAHGHFINSNDNEGAEYLNEILPNRECLYCNESEEDGDCPLIKGEFDIVNSGFIL